MNFMTNFPLGSSAMCKDGNADAADANYLAELHRPADADGGSGPDGLRSRVNAFPFPLVLPLLLHLPLFILGAGPNCAQGGLWRRDVRTATVAASPTARRNRTVLGLSRSQFNRVRPANCSRCDHAGPDQPDRGILGEGKPVHASGRQEGRNCGVTPPDFVHALEHVEPNTRTLCVPAQKAGTVRSNDVFEIDGRVGGGMARMG
jgi:hypothetical protein